MNIFNASEVLKVAVQIEKNGLAFYQAIKERSKNFSVAEVFSFLAQEEEKHQRTFERLLAGAGDYQPQESYPGEYELYLEAIAGENIFKKENDFKKAAQEIKSDSAGIDMGIGFEKNSIIFYTELKKFVAEEDSAIVDKIIAEEKEHLTKLFNLKDKK